VVVHFLDLPRSEFARDAEALLDRRGFESALASMNGKAEIVSSTRWDDTGEHPHVEVEIAAPRIHAEIDLLQRHDFSVLVCMTENGPHPTVQRSDLEVHHLPVEDTTPPTRAQAETFANILDRANAKNQRMVVHCMAGIGRTTTIIVAGHLLRGARLGEMIDELAVSNPDYRTKGSQWSFLQDLAEELGLH
jgi:protein-tyrosine phosphatase